MLDLLFDFQAHENKTTAFPNGAMMHDAELIPKRDDQRNSKDGSVGAHPLPLGAEEVMVQGSWEVPDARPLLPKAAFFMGDLRDGLPMVRFLLSACHSLVAVQ
jgi:hypothetical protein